MGLNNLLGTAMMSYQIHLNTYLSSKDGNKREIKITATGMKYYFIEVGG